MFDILLLGVLNISDETLFSCLIYCFSLFGFMLFGFLVSRWNTPSRVWYITSRCLAYIRWNTFLVFNILLLASWIYAFRVFRYQTKHSFLCLMYYFSAFGHQLEHSFSCLTYYFSLFGNQIKHLCIQLCTMCSIRLFMQRKQKIQIWITFKSFVKVWRLYSSCR